MKNTNKGFTLVELAIVIVIIGLLVGGVLQGQELIKQAQIRSALSTIQGYNAAINTFRAKYNEMPGDIARAANFGINCPKGVTCAAGAQNICGTFSSNGNGNGILESSADCSAAFAVATNATSTFNGEISNFWTHLGNAQLVKGNYAYSATPVVGTNYPSMPIGTGITAASDGGLLYWVLGTPGSLSAFGGTAAAGTVVSNAPTMTPSEAYGIDSKLDDGRPGLGSMQQVTAYSAAGAFTAATDVNCADSTTASSANYNLGTNADAKKCAVRVRADG